MTTAPDKKRFGLVPEMRISELIQILLLIVAISGWAVRTEGKIEKVAASSHENARSIEAVTANLREFSLIVREMQREQVETRIELARHRAADEVAE